MKPLLTRFVHREGHSASKSVKENQNKTGWRRRETQKSLNHLFTYEVSSEESVISKIQRERESVCECDTGHCFSPWGELVCCSVGGILMETMCVKKYCLDRWTHTNWKTAHIQSSCTHKLQYHSHTHRHTHVLLTPPDTYCILRNVWRVWKWLWSVKLLHWWEVSTVRVCVSFLWRLSLQGWSGTDHSGAEGRAESTQQVSGRICAFTNVQNIRTVFSEHQLAYVVTLTTFTGDICVHWFVWCIIQALV